MSGIRKLFITSIATFVAFASLLVLPPAQADASRQIGKNLFIKDNLTIMINGERLAISDPILNQHNFTLLPMRALYEAVDAQVNWDQANQTATALRQGTTLQLKINSSVALVNNEQKQLGTPAIMHNNRTYLPLRFVIEHFDGQVTYNHEAQLITITTNNEPITEPIKQEPFTLHLNNKRIVMEKPPIMRQNRNYISAEYFYNNLDHTALNWIDKDILELQIEGLVFTFFDKNSTIHVNQTPIPTNEPPFLHNGDMYIPVHFVVNALGGNLRYRPDTRELYIYLNPLMFMSEFLTKQEGPTKRPTLLPSAELVGSRTLLVSDNPETLTPDVVPLPSSTLSEQFVSTSQQNNEHRIFGWHFNKLGKNVHLGVTIENTSNSNLTLTSSTGLMRKSNNSWINYDIGLPIADLLLNDRMEKRPSEGMVIKPGETAIIDQFEVLNGYIIGLINDITVQTWGQASYTIRTVVSETAEQIPFIHTSQVPVNNYAAHPRGVWPSSTIAATLPTYETGTEEIGYNISNRQTDHLLTEGNSASRVNGSIGNPGHFGMTYQLKVPIVNNSSTTQTVRLKVAGRGGLYSGAFKVDDKVLLVPTLKPATEYVELIDLQVAPGTKEVNIKLMHAGGAALPVALYLETVQ